jgi:NAD(P)-dependent dehydrogenase (short-subunit alcohol dehydrogenase family)
MTGRLAGKVAIITGASRGLGSYCAEGFGAEGASVVIAARSHDPAADTPGTTAHTARLVEAAGGVAFPWACDVGDPASIQAMAEATLERFGRIDVLMTNAVYYAPGDFSTIEPADWERQFRINVHGVFHAIRAVLPSMIENGGGNIITVTSIAAERISHYGATKRAVAGMTVGFAEEQRSNGVAVNALRPVAAIRTPGWEQSRPAEVLQARAHRVSPPDSYVEAAVLLAMRTAADCTGQTFTDAEVLKRFGDPDDLARFSAMNAAVWRESL